MRSNGVGVTTKTNKQTKPAQLKIDIEKFRNFAKLVPVRWDGRKKRAKK